MGKKVSMIEVKTRFLEKLLGNEMNRCWFRNKGRKKIPLKRITALTASTDKVLLLSITLSTIEH